jgi:diadenosine tetraphosphate (Ap4A) HIT family hydrolase
MVPGLLSAQLRSMNQPGPPSVLPSRIAPEASCGVCRIHADRDLTSQYEILREGAWLLRHHPHPAPLVGWLLLDTVRHVGGPADFDAHEAAGFGVLLQRSCALVRQLSGCERVYAIAFGEGARHFHLHLIPRHASEPRTESWRVADLYRAVAAGEHPPADPSAVAAFVALARRGNPGGQER